MYDRSLPACWRLLQTWLLSVSPLFLIATLIVASLQGTQRGFAGEPQKQSLVRSLAFVPRDALFVANFQPELFKDDIFSTIRSQVPVPRLPAVNLSADSVQEATIAIVAGRRNPAAILKCRLDDAGTAALQTAIAQGAFSSSEVEGRKVFTGARGAFTLLAPDTILITESLNMMLRSLLTASASDTLWAAQWENSNSPVFMLANTSLLRSSEILRDVSLNSRGPISYESIYRLARTTDYISMQFDLGDELTVQLRGISATADEAAQASAAIAGSVGAGRMTLSALRDELITSGQAAQFLPYIDFLDRSLERIRIENRSNQVAAQMTISGEALSSIRKGLEASVRVASTARRRMQMVNRLKQVGLALHNYESAYQRFPAAVQTMTNGVERSWRVTVSPFLEASAVWNAYKQEEAWDSPANRELLTQIPPTFQADGAEVGMTDIFVFNGPGAIFNMGEYSWIGNITDSTSNTIWTIALPQPVPWTKPTDIPFDAKKPLALEIPSTGIIVGVADGSVRHLPPNVDLVELQKAITASGGELIELW